MLAAAMALAGCGERVGEYLPVSAVARGGFLTGRLSTFPAPAQVIDLTGLSLQLRSSQDIRLDPPEGR